MREKEAENLKDDIWHAICKKGIPINVRTGQNMDAADWVKETLEKHIKIDEPVGIVRKLGYEWCPSCDCVVGNRAFFCKNCGTMLRAK